MKKIICYIFLIISCFGNTYELKLNQLEFLKQDRDKYLRQKNIVYSELEKLQYDEKIVKKEFEIGDFLQNKIEEKMKYEARLDEIAELTILLKAKEAEFSRNYNGLKGNNESISKFDLAKLESNIQVTKKELEKIILEKEYINYLLMSPEYLYIQASLKKKKFLDLLTDSYNSLIEIKKQEFKITEIEQKGETFVRLKQLELDNIILEKDIEINNNQIKMKELQSKKDISEKDLEITKTQLEIQNKELSIIEEKAKIGAGSQKELFEKIVDKYDLLEKIVQIRGEIKLKEIELNQ